jgi:uncharacterized membrane protein YbjE (DUF340 family)
MLTDALLILAPLFLGFALRLESRRLMTAIHYLVEGLVYFILALLGVGLGQMEGLTAQLGAMAGQVISLVLVLAVFNLVGLALLHGRYPLRVNAGSAPTPTRYSRLFMAGLRPLLAVVAGALAGLWLLPAWPLVDDVATWSLMVLLLLIGLQLRNAGLSLRRLLFNRHGLSIALVLAGSSLLAGLIASVWLPLGAADTLALASGFGWYSLSGIVIGDALGPAWGGVAFLNDVIREIIALAIIPALIAARPAVAIGYGGATAMDFTLPVIRSHGGLECVPVAIASGFILSFLSPILMAVFLAIN